MTPPGFSRKTGKPKKKPRGKPFPKGVSGNPNGRPRYGKISEAIRFILDLPPEEQKTFAPDSYAEKIALGMIQKAAAKDKGAAEFVANRAEGTPVATTKATVDILSGADVILETLKPQGPEEPKEPGT